MRRVIFWSTLIAANVGVVLLMFIDRCSCAVPEAGALLWRFAIWGGLFGALFALASLPIALLWRSFAVRRSVWRPLSAPKMALACALVGSCFYGYLEHRWLMEERHEFVTRR